MTTDNEGLFAAMLERASITPAGFGRRVGGALVPRRCDFQNAGMQRTWRTIVVMPAYNAANTLERVYDDIPKEHVDEVIVVDDCSKDNTVEIAKRLPVTLIQHEHNTGYGGNQKTCYDTARAHGADFVVMI